MTNWISFSGYPPFEMLLRPCSNDPSVPFSLYQEDQFVDFFGGGEGSPLLDPSSEAITDVQDSSSSLTIHQDSSQVLVAIPVSSSEVEESVSLDGNKASINGQSTESVLHMTPSTVEATAVEVGQEKAVAVTMVSTPVGSGQRSSVYRGVTRHRWTGRYEAHLWDNTCRREGQKRKGRQVYLGGYDKEDKAARAYDLAALKYWGLSATTNFPATRYSQEMEIMKNMTKQEFIASIRRNSSGFSRGASIYRGVTRHHQQGRWQARIGRVAGNKDLYLGTFSTEEDAAEAYDVAAIKFRGSNAVTNFALSRYDVEAIENTELPIGTGSAKRMKKVLQANNSDLSRYGVGAFPNMGPSIRESARLVKQSLMNNSNQPTVATVNTVSNSEVSRYTAETIAATDSELPVRVVATQWKKDAFQTNATLQQAVTSSTASEHPNNDPSTSLHSLLQLQSSASNDSVSLAFYGLGEDSPDLCGQNFCWPLMQQSSTKFTAAN